LLGEVASVWSFSGRLSELNIDVEDCAEIGLAFTNGVIGSLHLNYIQQPPAHQVEIVGSAGTLTWDYYTSQTRSYQAQLGEWSIYSSAGGFERNDLFLSEMRHFLQIIRGEAVPVCSLDDGIHALDLSLAAFQSQEQGKLIHVQS
jgi:predicted dehydrogenase